MPRQRNWSDAEIDQTIDELNQLVSKDMIRAIEDARRTVGRIINRELRDRGLDQHGVDAELANYIKTHVWEAIEQRLFDEA